MQREWLFKVSLGGWNTFWVISSITWNVGQPIWQQVCVRREREERGLLVTQQSFYLSISSKTHWHTFRKHSLHPPTTLPSLLSSLCLSASLLLFLSLHLFLSGSLSSFLRAICLFLFHSLVKGLVETLRVFQEARYYMHSQQIDSTFVKRWNAVWNSTCHPDPLDCISQYLYTKVNA